MRKIQKKDFVIVLAGKDKGKTGIVQSVINGSSIKKTDPKVIVMGVNKIIKHEKPNPNKGVKGGRVEKEKPIDISNVAIYNKTTSKKDKVKIKVEDGKKVRVYASTGEIVEKELS
tara:strand:- start:26759 stop:27103 length:345 start_codon:yes stop_codon:yes gene_type:complete